MFLIRNQFYYIYTTNERKSSMNVVENEIIKKIESVDKKVLKCYYNICDYYNLDYSYIVNYLSVK